MAKTKSIPIAAEIADNIAQRFFILEATVRCIQASLDESGNASAVNAAEALLGVVNEIERIETDLDVCAWDKQKAKEVRS